MTNSQAKSAVFFLVVIIGLCLPFTQALAYVDPGTGSAIFGSLSILLVGAGAALGFLFRPFINLFRKIFGKSQPADETPAQEAETSEDESRTE